VAIKEETANIQGLKAERNLLWHQYHVEVGIRPTVDVLALRGGGWL
jgi:hypothetical protein